MTMRSIALLAVAAVAAATGCTTKTFEPLPSVGADGLKAVGTHPARPGAMAGRSAAPGEDRERRGSSAAVPYRSPD